MEVLAWVQRRRSRTLPALAGLLLLACGSHLLLLAPARPAAPLVCRRLLPDLTGPQAQSSTRSYYPSGRGGARGAELAGRVAALRSPHGPPPPTLTVPTRGPAAGGEALGHAIGGDLARHGHKRPGLGEVDGEIDVVVGEAVNEVKELGIDKVKKRAKVKNGKGENSFGEMLKTGLNTFSMMQKVLEGGEGTGGPVAALVSGLLGGGEEGGGAGGRGLLGTLALLAKGRPGGEGQKFDIDPLLDSAFGMLGDEEATGGVKTNCQTLDTLLIAG